MSWLLVKRFPLWLSIILTAVVFALLGWAGASVWYWEQLHLKFDSSLFSDICGPLFSLAGVVVYGVTLGYLIQQNRINYSNSVKTNYSARLDKLIEEVNRFNHRSAITKQSYNFHQMPLHIMDLMKKLNRRQEFLDYYKDLNNIPDLAEQFTNTEVVPEHLEIYMELNDLIDYKGSHYLYMLRILKEFILELEKSKMLEDEIKNLKLRIRNEALYGLHTQTWPLMLYNTFLPSMLFIRSRPPEFESKPVPLSETEFYKMKTWFDQNLPRSSYFLD